mgnify:CR=1 FL=1
MNKTVSKLLSKYATISDQSVRDLKKWWNTLDWREKTAEKKRILEELGLSESEEEVETVEEEEEA